MNIGLFFGTFNPPHLGHVSAVYTILESKYVDKVIVIPAFRNPWKEKNTTNISPDTEYFFRHNLCKIMFEDLIKDNKVMIYDVEYEIWRDSHKYEDDIIYTYETINRMNNPSTKDYVKDVFKIDENERINYVITTTVETFATIKDWKYGASILSNQKFLLLTTEDLMQRVHNIDNLKGYPIIYYDGIDIHSTDIRNQISLGKNPLPYISCKAYKYIKDNKYNFSL